MGVGRIFSRVGAIVDFSRRWPKAIFQGGAKSDEILFYQLDATRKMFFY